MTVQFSCDFAVSPEACGFYLQSAAPTRVAIVSPGRTGRTAVELTTLPGDINIAGSGTSERCDLELPPSAAYGNQGSEEWWAHSIMFPSAYAIPPAGNVWEWGVVFDFHNSLAGGGQANFQIVSLPTGLGFWVAGGPVVLNSATYELAIGPITKNVWYDFMYHIKWSSNADGLFEAWLNGKLLMDYLGPNLYAGQSAYLKLANYHSAWGVPSSVIHSHVVRGTTQADVKIGNPSAPSGLSVH